MFLVLVLVGLAAGAALTWFGVIRAARLPRRWSVLLTLLLAAGTVAIPAVLRSTWHEPRATARPWTWAAYTAMGVLFYLALFGGLQLTRALLRRKRRREPEVDPERRKFLGRVSAVATVAGAGGISAWGVRAAKDLQVVEREITLAKLPPAFDGFRLVQISDLHLGPLDGAEFLRRVVRRCNELQPDAIAVTGDVVDGSLSRIAADVAPLAELDAAHGVFLVAGNHEYYSGVRGWLDEFERLGLRVLRNERVEIRADASAASGSDSAAGETEAVFDLAGVHDWHGGYFGREFAPDLRAALAGRDPDRACVLLAHQPAQIDEAAELGVDLMLSGHTHGGQLWPFGLLTRLVQPYLRGTHLHGGRTWIHVSCGTGCWGPPMRVGAPAEITAITLRAQNSVTGSSTTQ